MSLNYLTRSDYESILKTVSVRRVDNIESKNLNNYSFDCGDAKEYESFLFEKARKLDSLGISKTFLIISNQTNELIGYFTLSTDTIRLTEDEKKDSNLKDVTFMSLPAIKIGKLAINKSLSSPIKRKGYGSFAIEMAVGKAYETLKNGVACRFITVDADIQYDKKTPNFYLKNGFVFNQAKKYRKSNTTISMRKDIFNV